MPDTPTRVTTTEMKRRARYIARRLDELTSHLLPGTIDARGDTKLSNTLTVAGAYYRPWLEEAFMSENPPRSAQECLTSFVKDWAAGYPF